jgi:hypothetical protein
MSSPISQITHFSSKPLRSCCNLQRNDDSGGKYRLKITPDGRFAEKNAGILVKNSSSSISLSRDRSIVPSKLSFSVFGERLSRKNYYVVVFSFAFHIAVQQPLKPLWSRLLLCDHEPSHTSIVLCLMSLLMSLLPASGEILSEFPSPRVILSFFHHPWPYWIGWPCQHRPAGIALGIMGSTRPSHNVEVTTLREGVKNIDRK